MCQVLSRLGIGFSQLGFSTLAAGFQSGIGTTRIIQSGSETFDLFIGFSQIGFSTLVAGFQSGIGTTSIIQSGLETFDLFIFGRMWIISWMKTQFFSTENTTGIGGGAEGIIPIRICRLCRLRGRWCYCWCRGRHRERRRRRKRTCLLPRRCGDNTHRRRRSRTAAATMIIYQWGLLTTNVWWTWSCWWRSRWWTRNVTNFVAISWHDGTYGRNGKKTTIMRQIK